MVESKSKHDIQDQKPVITDSSLAEARRLIGVDLRAQRGTLEVTREEIRRVAHLMGSDNPLYCDENYAKKTKWGGLIAPPFVAQWAGDYDVAPGLPGIMWIHGGSDWEWYQVMREGDVLTQRGRLVDAEEKVGAATGRFIIQYGELICRNQRDEIVARHIFRMARTPKRGAGGGEKGGMAYNTRLANFTPQQLADIEKAIEGEEIRGATPRYWEDVKVGDELPPLVKGPYRALDMIYGQSMHGILGFDRMGAHIVQYLRRKSHPGDTYIDPKTGAPDHPFRGHWEAYMAHEAGMPGIYDLSLFTRGPWLSQIVTNWMGDDGFLKKLSYGVRRPNVVGDVTWVKGKVTRTYVQGGEHLVDCDLVCENQLGESTAPGTATVRLPSKAK